MHPIYEVRTHHDFWRRNKVPETNKNKIVEISLHYLFSTESVIKIKEDISKKIGYDIDITIKNKITEFIEKIILDSVVIQ